MAGNTKRVTGPPQGSQHSPASVAASKRYRAAAALAALAPSATGSARYRRMRRAA